MYQMEPINCLEDASQTFLYNTLLLSTFQLALLVKLKVGPRASFPLNFFRLPPWLSAFVYIWPEYYSMLGIKIK